MDEVYRLIFRGEVLDGQHESVVKKRLAKSLNLNDDQAEKLFAGGSVVLKREADTRTAAKLQALFKNAGARLRVMPIEAPDVGKVHESELQGGSQTDNPAEQQQSDSNPSVESTSAFAILPVGSEVLTEAERQSSEVAEVNTDHISLEEVGSDLGAGSDMQADEVAVPEISHLSLAEVGADLQRAAETSERMDSASSEIDFEIAEVGTDVLPGSSDENAELDLDIDLDGIGLAEVGADIGDSKEETAPPAPDTSHLELDAD